ncbi:MAG: hypothetical protein WDN25_26765 [Acetobacteraceae bacterium]
MSSPASACQSARPLREPMVRAGHRLAQAQPVQRALAGQQPRHALEALPHVLGAVGLAEAARAVAGLQFHHDALGGAAHIHRADIELAHRHRHAVQRNTGDGGAWRRTDRDLRRRRGGGDHGLGRGAQRGREPRRLRRIVPSDQCEFDPGEVGGHRPHAGRRGATVARRIDQHHLHAAVPHRARQFIVGVTVHGDRERRCAACEAAACIGQCRTGIGDIGELQPSSRRSQTLERSSGKLPIEMQRQFHARSERGRRRIELCDQPGDVGPGRHQRDPARIGGHRHHRIDRHGAGERHARPQRPAEK